MALYVDEAAWVWRGTLWCHLLADDLDELHGFAQQLGLAREWFQHPPHASSPHYDLTLGKREQALTMGALSVDRRTIVAKARGLREQWRQTSTTLSDPHMLMPITAASPESRPSFHGPAFMAQKAPQDLGDRARVSWFPRPGRSRP